MANTAPEAKIPVRALHLLILLRSNQHVIPEHSTHGLRRKAHERHQT
jgi:hypothetical protein